MSEQRFLASSTRGALAWLLAYLAVIALVVVGFVLARQWAAQTYGTVTAHSDWETYRQQEAARQTEGEAPVKRRISPSPEPPALVLMRDHFTAVLALSWLLTSVLFATLMFMLRGVFRSGSKRYPLM